VDYGFLLGFNSEFYLIDRLALNLELNEKYLFKDKFGNFQFQAGIGCKIFIQ
jgi:hypothetical protein